MDDIKIVTLPVNLTQISFLGLVGDVIREPPLIRIRYNFALNLHIIAAAASSRSTAISLVSRGEARRFADISYRLPVHVIKISVVQAD